MAARTAKADTFAANLLPVVRSLQGQAQQGKGYTRPYLRLRFSYRDSTTGANAGALSKAGFDRPKSRLHTQPLGNGEQEILPPGRCDKLHADRQPLSRQPNRD